MQLIEVTTPALENEFISVNPLIQGSLPNYIRPLDKDIRDVFNKEKNKAYRFGETIRWILKNDAGQLIGRIAAFTNKKYKNKGDRFPVGGVGFFECINDQAAANLLFDTAKNWLKEKGMEGMDGPINFGERDRWWGLVVEGFQPPLFGMNYNPPYYKDLLESYGFQPFFHQICFGVDPLKDLSPKVWQRYNELVADPNFSCHSIKGDLKKYALDFVTVYNKAWAGHGGLKELKPEQAIAMFKKMKPVMDKRICWFAYYKEEPIAIFINLPDLNQWFKYLKGKFSVFHMLKFLWIKSTVKPTKFTGLVFGIVPEFQGKGVDSLLIASAKKDVDALGYTEYEMQWIGDFNPKMLNVAANFGDTFKTRQLTTYRYQFDRSLPFERHPMV